MTAIEHRIALGKSLARAAAVVVLTLLISCTDPPPPEIGTECSGHVREGQTRSLTATQSVEEGVDIVVCDVQDDFGIGKGRVWLIEGEWPLRVVLRFHLKGLEGLTLTAGEQVLQREDLEATEEDGYFEVEVPRDLLGDTRELKLHWIDFYRG